MPSVHLRLSLSIWTVLIARTLWPINCQRRIVSTRTSPPTCSTGPISTWPPSSAPTCSPVDGSLSRSLFTLTLSPCSEMVETGSVFAPIALSVFDGNVYWIDAVNHQLYRAPVQRGHLNDPHRVEVRLHLHRISLSPPFSQEFTAAPRALLIEHPAANPITDNKTNPCAHSSCSHICVVGVANVSVSSSTGWNVELVPRCLCPDGYESALFGSSDCVPMGDDAYVSAVCLYFRSLYPKLHPPYSRRRA